MKKTTFLLGLLLTTSLLIFSIPRLASANQYTSVNISSTSYKAFTFTNTTGSNITYSFYFSSSYSSHYRIFMLFDSAGQILNNTSETDSSSITYRFSFNCPSTGTYWIFLCAYGTNNFDLTSNQLLVPTTSVSIYHIYGGNSTSYVSTLYWGGHIGQYGFQVPSTVSGNQEYIKVGYENMFDFSLQDSSGTTLNSTTNQYVQELAYTIPANSGYLLHINPSYYNYYGYSNDYNLFIILSTCTLIPGIGMADGGWLTPNVIDGYSVQIIAAYLMLGVLFACIRMRKKIMRINRN